MSPLTEIHFWHIPKTAGTSIAGLIRRAYPQEDCIPAHTAMEILALPRKDVPKYRCYTGHFFSLLEPLVGRPLPTVTILRDPVRQSLSLLRHCQRHVPGAGWVAPLAARSLEFAWKNIPSCRRSIEKAWCPVLMNNFQTRVLGSDIQMPVDLRHNFYGMTYPFLEAAFCDPNADMEVIYDRAVARLETMALVGTVERLPETITLLRHLLGVELPAEVPRENANLCTNPPSQELMELVEKFNTYDSRLHRHATLMLERRMRPNAASTP
jgi:hypothetical protein